MKVYNGTLETKFLWIIPILLGISKSLVIGTKGSRTYLYALHITPWINIGFNKRNKKENNNV